MDILSQSEIEALLNSLGSDGDVAPTAPSPTASMRSSVAVDLGLGAGIRLPGRSEERRSITYEPYDFRRPDKFSKDQLRTMQMLHETFARLIGSSLSAYLRVSTHVDLVSVEQMPYIEYMRALNSSIITVFSLDPLAGQAILEIEFNVLLSMIDRLLGGPGNMVKNTNVLTEIEKALCESVVNRALRDLRTSWDNVTDFIPKRVSMETQSQFIQIVPPNDTVVSILFEIKVGDLRGAMSLCIPYLLLKPIAAKLYMQQWFTSSAPATKGKNLKELSRRLEKATVTCVCRLGTSKITVRDLIALDVGDTVVLNRRATEDVDFLVGKNVKFRGKPGTSGRKLALHINRIIYDDQ